MKRIFTYLSEMLYLLGQNRKRLVGLTMLFMVSSFLDVLGLGIIGPYLALVMDPSIATEGKLAFIFATVGMAPSATDALVILGIALVAVFLAKMLVAVFVNWKILRFSRRCRVELQGQLMQAYQQQPYVEYIQRNSSEYLKTIHDATGQFVSSVQGLLKMLSEGIVSVFILVFLAFTNGLVLAVLLLLLGATLFVYVRLFREKSRRYGEAAVKGIQRTIQGIHEGIEGFKELRILGKEKFFHKAMMEGAREFSNSWVKATLIAMFPRYFLEFVLVAFVVLFVVATIMLGGKIETVLPTLGVFAMASLRLLPAANLLSGGISKLSFSRYAITVLYEDMKRVETHAGAWTPKAPQKAVGKTFDELSLTEVGFRYPGSPQWALKDLTLSIRVGESIGIIGSSGSGKTTLIDVLLGLLEPQEGAVSYNGVALRDSLEAWRSQVAYLPQETFIVDSTLRGNIALGVESDVVDEWRVEEAIRQAQLSDLVKELSDGLDTSLGERGVRLSGGQRQRVALARAFYFERNVLVMDEATSALDSATEREVVEEIKRLKGRKTLIVIAHRLTTVEHCDRIYRLEHGKIVESGSYEFVVGKTL